MAEVGRPSVMTDEVLQKLKEAFLMGCSDVEACLFAGIASSTLYEYQNKNPEYSEQKAEWKKNPLLRARKNIYDKIIKGDIETSKWYAERKGKEEFSTRQEVTGEEGTPVQIIVTRE